MFFRARNHQCKQTLNSKRKQGAIMRLVKKSLFVLIVILISAIVITSILYYELGTKTNVPQAKGIPHQ
jgi:hypothetical protein